MKNVTLKDIIKYHFDNLMSKGTIALIGVLFLVTAIFIIITSLIMLFFRVGRPYLGDNMWLSVMHVIDAGTITGADNESILFLFLMTLVTLCGLFITSILIGIITSGFENKLRNLRKGNSRIIEKNHTVILGFSDSIFTLIDELILSNSNKKDSCITILAIQAKEEIEDAVAARFDKLKSTRIIVRSGSPCDRLMLSKCSLDTASVVIINEEDDLMTVKNFIALRNYLQSQKLEKNPFIVSTIHKEEHHDAIHVISNQNAELILVEDAIARIIAQSCRQSGISTVLIELFNFAGDELYFEKFPGLNGQTFAHAMLSFKKAVVFGFKRNQKIYLNPAKDTVLEKNDELILLAQDDGVSKVITPPKLSVPPYLQDQVHQNIPETTLILGTNCMINQIVCELANYLPQGSSVIIADDVFSDELTSAINNFKHIQVRLITANTTRRNELEALLSDDIEHVVLLSDDHDDSQTADAKTLLRLVHLQEYATKQNRNFNITSELKNIENYELALTLKVNDLVIGPSIVNLIMAQISQNRDLAIVFRELLRTDGSEIYIEKASQYIPINKSLSFYEITAILSQHNAIAIGYKIIQENGKYEIITNPNKSHIVTLSSQDYLIMLANN